MPLFAVSCLDNPDSLELRAATRPDHLAYLEQSGRVKLAGPLLDPATEKPMGSLLIVEADDLAEAQAFAEADPYARAGLFRTAGVRPFKAVIGQL